MTYGLVFFENISLLYFYNENLYDIYRVDGNYLQFKEGWIWC